MKIMGFFVTLCGGAIAWFAFRLWVYFESSHGGSSIRIASSRIVWRFHENPDMYEFSKNIFKEVDVAYSWLGYSLLALLAASAVLLMAGIYALFGTAKSRSVGERT